MRERARRGFLCACGIKDRLTHRLMLGKRDRFMESQAPTGRSFNIQGLWFAATVLLGVGVAFYSQAASPNYRALFSGVAPVAIVQAVSAILYAWRVRSFSRWVILVVSTISLVSVGELATRVFGNNA